MGAHRRLGFVSFLLMSIACAAETPSDGVGAPCVHVKGVPVCADGLICNTGGLTEWTCQRPKSVPEGGRCGDDANCADGLHCSGRYSICTPIGAELCSVTSPSRTSMLRPCTEGLHCMCDEAYPSSGSCACKPPLPAGAPCRVNLSPNRPDDVCEAGFACECDAPIVCSCRPTGLAGHPCIDTSVSPPRGTRGECRPGLVCKCLSREQCTCQAEE